MPVKTMNICNGRIKLNKSNKETNSVKKLTGVKLLPLSVSQIKDQLPHLKAIIQYNGEVKNKMPNLYTVGLKFNSIYLWHSGMYMRYSWNILIKWVKWPPHVHVAISYVNNVVVES